MFSSLNNCVLKFALHVQKGLTMRLHLYTQINIITGPDVKNTNDFKWGYKKSTGHKVEYHNKIFYFQQLLKSVQLS